MDGIVISKVSKQYFDVKGNPFLALNQVSFEWHQGENLAVIDVYKRQPEGPTIAVVVPSGTVKLTS